MATRKKSHPRRSFVATSVVQLTYSKTIVTDSASIVIDPDHDVGSQQPGKDFEVSYISIFSRVPTGQFVQCSIDLGEGEPWFAMIPQGTFNNGDEYVCSHPATFVFRNGKAATFKVLRSGTTGTGTINVFLVGSFV